MSSVQGRPLFPPHSMRIRATLPLILALLLSFARPLFAQQTRGADLSGTWVINLAKSNFGRLPPPTVDSFTVTRAGTMYQIEATTDFGGQGRQNLAYKWPVGEGETTTDLSNGATMHTTIKAVHDTLTYSTQISVQGQTVALQTGREYLSSNGNLLTREMDIVPLVGPSSEPIHLLLVFDRR